MGWGRGGQVQECVLRMFLKSVFQNTRVICTDVPSEVSKIEAFATDSFVMYVLCYTQN